MSLELGIINYDVPIHRKNVYSRITKPLRPFSMMLSWSVYLFQWGHKDAIKAIMESINTDKDSKQPVSLKDKVRYNISKFDSSDQQALDEMVKYAYTNMLKTMKEGFVKSLEKANLNGIDSESCSIAIKRARKHLREMESLALVFSLTNCYAYALAAFENQINAEAITLAAAENQANAEINILTAIKNQIPQPA